MDTPRKLGRPPTILGEKKHFTVWIEQKYLDRAALLYPNLPVSEAVRQTIRSGLTALEQVKGSVQ